GTIFYVKFGSNSSIYVLHNGQKVEAIKSWDGKIYNFECFGNALYFETNTKKIYKATFQPSNEIRLTFIRDLEKGESSEDILLRRKINGKEVIYRACDDPKNGIIVDVEDEKLSGCWIRAIHRGKLIYSNDELEEATANSLSPKI
ncbi:hypothetical protein PFISCL1PPCAC_17009, partial [Pristionchus fissidentatus]